MMTIPSLTPLSTPPSRTTGSFDDAMDTTLVELDAMVDQLNEVIPAINAAAAAMTAVGAEVTVGAAEVAAAVLAVQEVADQAGEAATDAVVARDASGAARDEAVAARDAGEAARDEAVAARDAGEAARDEAVAARLPTHYDRTNRWQGARTTLAPPAVLSVVVGEVAQRLQVPPLDITQASAWGGVTDYLTGAARAGRDFYVYVVAGGVVLSPNVTTPVGQTTATARKIGGFHCLCADVGVISEHPLSGYLAGDILPASVWDLYHRPVCSPEGMVYVEGIGKWVDIYLASVSGGALVSQYAATIADGASATAFDGYDFSEWLGRIGKRLPTQTEFMALSHGANQGTNISGAADPVTAGGHVDTAGRRMVSHCGAEDCCGAMWQWGIEAGGPVGAASWIAQYNPARTAQLGDGYNTPNRALLGGNWSTGTHCGSRCTYWATGSVNAVATIGARGVAEPVGDMRT
ncbi:MAG TPA: hypothetical protein PKC79_09405 [Solidesulfovibrio magneticus]|nr:hypothetical protein [Solidesulfovibrio magneticus]